ncbi:hypothetical protein [Mesorhizobium sp.]|nr:hypothetical protein [Mesorhizobium sp.]
MLGAGWQRGDLLFAGCDAAANWPIIAIGSRGDPKEIRKQIKQLSRD